MRTRTLPIVIVICAAFCLVSCKEDKKKEEATEKMEQTDKAAEAAKEAQTKKEAMASSIVGKATGTENLSTLVSALKAADLTPMLSEAGNYTLFAPTDNAFSKLKKGKLEELLQPENKEELTSLLQYHVVSGKIMVNQLLDAIKTSKGKYTFKTMGGGEITATMDGDQVVLKDAKGGKSQVLQGNIEASNGIIHVVNDVLMPKK